MQCNEAQSWIPLFLENKLTLDQKYELVGHIRTCSKCREELEFYFVVYDTIGKFDDQVISGDYAAEAERLLCQVEKERQNAVRAARVHRFRLILAFLLLTLGMSFGVRDTIIEEENKQDMMVESTPSFYLEGFSLPEQFSFVQQAIQTCEEEAKGFANGQRVRAILRQRLYDRDVPVMHILKNGAVIEYKLSVTALSEAVLTADEPTYTIRLEAPGLPENME